MKYLIAYLAGALTFLLALAVCNRTGVRPAEEWPEVEIDPDAYENVSGWGW